jgi:hypothetical protein
VTGRAGLAQLYPTLLRQRYGRYFFLGRRFVELIGNPAVMRWSTDHVLPRERMMRFALRVLGNLTDGRSGDLDDKLMYVLERLTPAA